MRMVSVLLMLFGMGMAASSSAVGLDSLAVATIDLGLQIQGVGVDELGYYKQWAVDSVFRLKTVDWLLDNPLDVVGYVESAAARVSCLDTLPAGLLGYQLERLDLGWSRRDSARLWKEVLAARRPFSGSAQLSRPLVDAIVTALAGFEIGQRYLDQAVAKLRPEELDRMLGLAPDYWRDSDDSTLKSLAGALHAEFGRTYDTSQDVKSETLLAYARRLDRKALAKSGLAVVMAVTEARRLLMNALAELSHDGDGQSVLGVDGNVLFVGDTRWGKVVIGGAGDNSYRGNYCLIIDIGGNDRYLGRAAGGVGIIGSGFGACIDLDGNDLYHSDRLFSQGAALFGAGVLIDCAGDDIYRSVSYCQGAAIYGTGLLWDQRGGDFYDGGFFAQGAGMYGAAALVDEEANDTYRSLGYCQAFAGTWGYGLLLEHGGNDLYYAGGRVRHEPLLPHEYRSFAQGFAIGQRPDAGGGIGFLCDTDGNDFYNAEVFCQGTSYWYSLGMLWDRAGFDKYSAAQYSQGAGIHLSVGALVDGAGNDAYHSRLGPSQGEGHDLSVGVLVDRQGDDSYYCSGGQGIGLTNSVGLFVDADGNDAYTCTESLICHGSSNWARGFGGMGVFCDLAGRDKYSIGNAANDETRWTKGTYGSGLDLPRPASVVDEEPDVDTTDSGIDSIALPVDSVFKIASTWAVGNAQKRVKRARKQLNRLGTAALAYVFEKKADTKSGLELEAIEALVKAWPDSAKPFLFRSLRDERYLVRQNAAYLFGKLGRNAVDAVDSIYSALKARRISPRRAAQAFGDIGDSLIVPKILYLLQDTFQPSRIVTAEACGKLKNPAAVPALIRNLADSLFTARSAAEAALIAIGSSSVRPLLAAMPKMKAPALGHAVRALGAIATKFDSTDTLLPVVRDKIAAYVTAPVPFVRLVAVEAAGRLLDDSLRAILVAAREEESNEFVQTKYRLLLDRQP